MGSPDGYRAKTKTHLNEFEDKALTEEELAAVWDALRVDSPNNPWPRLEAVRVRNAIMFLVLYETGIRRGELGNIRVSDVNFRTHTLKIRRRQNSKSDPRTRQPNVKTRERGLPISEELSGHIEAYVLNERRCNRAARKHDILFVSHQGATLGHPLAMDSINYVFRCLQATVPALSGIHPHRLRHHANYEITLTIDEKYKGRPPEERQKADQQIRSQIMGWSPTGTQQARYNKRYTQEKVEEATSNRNEKFSSDERRRVLNTFLDNQPSGEGK
ncbi:tyrosine-type recombinase/integrase [Marinobacter manganoxydans]|uniref:Putative integrase/recombinase n=1 Tax=Marinobacter manganoxydans MnI7-9 TaxID=1094979 RepID=G6YUA1_9GAMM|nr:site-specific integrase [Marinobacter manganoxydans]EHJ04231.1 putative integrase/recombinase [Marinobacter manganoxydans MnI7-9]